MNKKRLFQSDLKKLTFSSSFDISPGMGKKPFFKELSKDIARNFDIDVYLEYLGNCLLLEILIFSAIWAKN